MLAPWKKSYDKPRECIKNHRLLVRNYARNNLLNDEIKKTKNKTAL